MVQAKAGWSKQRQDGPSEGRVDHVKVEEGSTLLSRRSNSPGDVILNCHCMTLTPREGDSLLRNYGHLMAALASLCGVYVLQTIIKPPFVAPKLLKTCVFGTKRGPGSQNGSYCQDGMKCSLGFSNRSVDDVLWCNGKVLLQLCNSIEV